MRRMLLTSLGKTGSKWLAKKEISRRSLLNFARNTTGLVILEEAIDLASEYSDWVKENQTLLLIALSLGGALRGSLGKLRSVILTKSTVPTLFAKVSYSRMRAQMAQLAKTGVVKVLRDGVHVTLPNGDFIKVVRDLKSKRLIIDHSGTLLTSTLLASGLAGAAFALDLDWSTSGESLLMAGIELLLDIQEQEMIDEMRGLPAVQLLTSQSSVARSMRHKFPLVGDEQIAACMMRVLTEEETHFGEHYVIAHKDADGDIVYTVDGVNLMFDEEDNSLVLSELGESPVELGLDKTPFGAAFVDLVSHVEHTGGVVFTRVRGTDRFVSKIFGQKDAAVVLQWDEASKQLTVTASTAGWFSDADSSLSSMQKSTVSEDISNAFGKAIDEIDFWSDADVPAPGQPESEQITVSLRDVTVQLGKN